MQPPPPQKERKSGKWEGRSRLLRGGGGFWCEGMWRAAGGIWGGAMMKQNRKRGVPARAGRHSYLGNEFIAQNLLVGFFLPWEISENTESVEPLPEANPPPSLPTTLCLWTTLEAQGERGGGGETHVYSACVPACEPQQCASK